MLIKILQFYFLNLLHEGNKNKNKNLILSFFNHSLSFSLFLFQFISFLLLYQIYFFIFSICSFFCTIYITMSYTLVKKLQFYFLNPLYWGNLKKKKFCPLILLSYLLSLFSIDLSLFLTSKFTFLFFQILHSLCYLCNNLLYVGNFIIIF